MDADELLTWASSTIRRARVELHELLPARGHIDEFGAAYTATLFANAAAHLQATELLIANSFTSSAAVVLRTFIFASIRLAWLADAETTDELDARVVAFQKTSLDYEAGLLAKARKSGGDPARIDQLTQILEKQRAEVQSWKSETGTERRQVDEIAIAETLPDMGGLVTAIAILDQHAHINRLAINSVLAPDPRAEGTLTVGHRPETSLIPTMITASMQALSIAATSFVKVVDPDPEVIELVRAAGQQWVNDAIQVAEAHT